MKIKDVYETKLFIIYLSVDMGGDDSQDHSAGGQSAPAGTQVAERREDCRETEVYTPGDGDEEGTVGRSE